MLLAMPSYPKTAPATPARSALLVLLGALALPFQLSQAAFPLPIPTRSTKFATPAAQAIAWGDASKINVPAGFSDLVAVAAGRNHSLALRSNGLVIPWGENLNWQHPLLDIIVANRYVAIAAGNTFAEQPNFTMAVRPDGTVILYNPPFVVDFPFASDAVAIAATDSFPVVLMGDGTVRRWEARGFGSLPVILEGFQNIVAVAAGFNHIIALDQNGNVLAWGSNTYGEGTVPEGARSRVKMIAAGSSHNLAQKENGEIIAWGRNDSGQANVPPGLRGVKSLVAGDNYSAALKTDGTVVVWGGGGDAVTQVPLEADHVIAISGGARHIVALQRVVFQPTSAQLKIVHLDPGAPFDTIQVISPGSGYVDGPNQPIVHISPYYANPMAQTVSATVKNGQVIDVHGYHISNGKDYSGHFPPVYATVSIDPPPSPSTLSPRPASVLVEVVDGAVVDLKIAQGGAGYKVAPEITLVGGDGLGAAATLTVFNGEVVGYTITQPGSGYTSPPAVVFAGSQPTPALTAILKNPGVLQVSAQVATDHRYQFQTSTNLETWAVSGDPFLAQTGNLVREFEVQSGRHYFRITQLP